MVPGCWEETKESENTALLSNARLEVIQNRLNHIIYNQNLEWVVRLIHSNFFGFGGFNILNKYQGIQTASPGKPLIFQNINIINNSLLMGTWPLSAYALGTVSHHH